MPLRDQDKLWAPCAVSKRCVEILRAWNKNNKRTFEIWNSNDLERAQRSFQCFCVCMNDMRGFNKQKKLPGVTQV